VKAVEYLEAGGETTSINLGTSRGSSVWEIVKAAEAVIGRSVPFEAADRRAGDPVELYADIRKAKLLLGWEPLRGIDEIMQSEWAWRQRHPQGFSGA